MRSLPLASALLASAFALACSGPTQQATPAPGAAPDAAAGEAVAVVQGQTITGAQLETWIKNDLYEQQVNGKSPAELYEFREESLDRMITDALVRAEAQKRGTTSDQLFQQESGRFEPVGDAEAKAWYDANQQRVGGQPYETIAARIKSFLERDRRQQAWQKFVGGLRDQAKVEVKMEPPRVEVAATGPSRGPANAPVTIVEFSDYECPFCRRAEPTVEQVLARYPEQVRLVYRHYPLPMHPNARPAAEASACAGEQDKFWEYHDRAMGGALDAASLEKYATEIGLDVPKFKACVAEGRFKDAIAADQKAGEAAGVSGTPAFFVNGVMLSGARPIEDFVKLIDGELARAGAAAPKAEGAAPPKAGAPAPPKAG